LDAPFSRNTYVTDRRNFAHRRVTTDHVQGFMSIGVGVVVTKIMTFIPQMRGYFCCRDLRSVGGMQ